MKVVWLTGLTTTEKVLFPLDGLLAVLGLVLYMRMIRRLRSRHPDKWAALGSPQVLSRASVAWAVVTYLLGAGHRELADEALEQLARRWRLIYVMFVLVMAGCIYEILRYGP